MRKTSPFFTFFICLCTLLLPTSSFAQFEAVKPEPLITSSTQLSSPFSDSVEGQHIEYLLDGDPNTFWHTDWHNQTTGDVHWIEIDLGQPITGLLTLYMHRRNTTNDHPTRVEIRGSMDGKSWHPLGTVLLPYQGFNGVQSEPWAVRQPVRYMRLAVTDCMGGAGVGYRKIWHAAELQIYRISREYDFDTSLSGVQFNEVQLANIDQFIDNSYNYGGWVELTNTGSRLQALSKARIRHTTARGVVKEASLSMSHGLLPPNSFLCLWFGHHSSQGIYGGQAHLQIPFKLDSEGGVLELVDEAGQTIQKLVMPPAIARCSYARMSDGDGAWEWTSQPSPSATNHGSDFSNERLPAPEVSSQSSLFVNGLQFSVKIPSGTTLRYTTDGSTPTATHGQTARVGSFTTYSTRVYRFVLVAPGKLPSPVVTRTFIKNEQQLRLPILIVSTHPDNLYDPEIGVYVKGTNGVPGNGQSEPCNWNMDWERPVNVEYLVRSADGKYHMVLNQEADFEIAGGWTRAYGGGNGWEMKSSFRLKAGKVFEGQKAFNYPFFEHSKPYNKYKTLQVRNGGNDTYARILDPAVQEIFRRSGYYIDLQAWQPCHVYFNGRYLGMLNIRENNNKNYADSEYGVDPDHVDQFELNGSVGYEQKSGTRDAFWQWLQLSKKVAANPQDDVAWAQIEQLVDVDEYCNYMAAECYIGSSDWMTNCNNIKGFRSRVDGGKFHLVLFDTDAAFTDQNMIHSMHELLSQNDGRFADNEGKNYLAEIFFNMMQRPQFKQQFGVAFSLVAGSVMEPERCTRIIDEMADSIRNALAIEENNPDGTAQWLKQRITNPSERAERIGHMRDYLKPSRELQLHIQSNLSQARVAVDGQEIPTGRFSGPLFSATELSVSAPAGYKFRGWNMMDLAAQQHVVFPFQGYWQYYDQGSLDAVPWKDAAYSSSGWKRGKAPLGYGGVGTSPNAADYHTTLDFGGDPKNKRPTYYFRKNFVLTEEPDPQDRFLLYYYLDDGALFYVNGKEVGSYHLNSGASYGDFATAFESNTAALGQIEIPAAYFHKGSNVLAVEVHNISPTSSDIFFDARLLKAQTKTEIVSTSPLLDLETLPMGGEYHLTALFDPLPTPQQIWEDGASPLRINEVSAANRIYVNDYFARAPWVEIYNTTDDDIDIAGMYLSRGRGTQMQRWRITNGGSSANTVCPGHGTLLIWCDGLPSRNQLHAPFSLDNADGACVSLQAENGEWADEMVYLAQDRWSSFVRYPDGGNFTALSNRPTIASSNRLSMRSLHKAPEEGWDGVDMAITLGLEKGWNWVSHNLSQSVHVTRFTAQATHVLGRIDSCVLHDDGAWYGALQTMESSMGYRVKMLRAGEVTIRGGLYDVAKPQVLHAGWNWVGCPLYNSTDLAVALANYQATEGDAIVGLDAFATYEDGTWQGSFSVLTPGQAYLLRSATAQQFCWNSLSRPVQRSLRYEAPWTRSVPQYDVHAHPHVASLIARPKIPDEMVLSGPLTLSAYVGNQCRGAVAEINGLFYLNIHGETGEEFTFRITDVAGHSYVFRERLRLQPESIIGSRKNPFLLTTDGTGVCQPMQSGAPAIPSQFYLLDGRCAGLQQRGVYLETHQKTNGQLRFRKVLR